MEHLSKTDGKIMIEQMEKVARKKIILTTPNGFLPTYAGPDDNPTEIHLSGWTVDELRKLGFNIYGLNGLKALWKVKSGQAVARFKPRRLFAILIDITQLFVYYYPWFAFQLFFVKDIKIKSTEEQK